MADLPRFIQLSMGFEGRFDSLHGLFGNNQRDEGVGHFDVPFRVKFGGCSLD